MACYPLFDYTRIRPFILVLVRDMMGFFYSLVSPLKEAQLPNLLKSLLLIVIVSTPPLMATSQTSRTEYGVKEDQPRTGSNIRRYAAGPFNIPINRRYEELTSAEKSLFNANYEQIKEGDEPPFPKDGLRPIVDALRVAQEKLRVRGKLHLIAKVDRLGDTIEVKTIGSPSEEMTKVAASILIFTKFKPAMCDGQVCIMDFPLFFSFHLE